jgi:hypothetical protein
VSREGAGCVSDMGGCNHGKNIDQCVLTQLWPLRIQQASVYYPLASWEALVALGALLTGLCVGMDLPCTCGELQQSLREGALLVVCWPVCVSVHVWRIAPCIHSLQQHPNM